MRLSLSTAVAAISLLFGAAPHTSLAAPLPPPAITSSTTATTSAGSAFSYQITATNDPSSFGATGLPAGLTVSSSSGIISGTATVTGTSDVALSAIGAGGTGTAVLVLTVLPPPPPVITSAAAQWGTTGSAFNYQIVATNAATSFTATGLPPGLSLDPSTGLVSGTPTMGGMLFGPTISAINASGTGSATLWITILTNFKQIAGAYEGLGSIDGTNTAQFNLSVTAAGRFTGKLTSAVASYPLSGTFYPWSTFSSVKDSGAKVTVVDLSISASPPTVTGTIALTTGSTFAGYSVATSLVEEFNSATLPSGLAGTYTIAIPAISGTDPTVPHAPGSGSMSVATTGATRLTGTLGDGTAFSANSQLQTDGTTCAFFSKLPYGKSPGSLAGYMTLDGSTSNTCGGTFDWVRPPESGTNDFSAGFSVGIDLTGTKN
jgi:hypothetical protein